MGFVQRTRSYNLLYDKVTENGCSDPKESEAIIDFMVKYNRMGLVVPKDQKL